ncbi:hypothetical protein M378DRAFT_182593 [Amanita muscaria Koide BX008]|uniref:Uncharacterized protein n=1 Tax=Amanita muscaria (strain Koide BX008) TaxID=946122 RepID=A0A0C2SK27_AMAMK|nr:hypothetical protein M378DRAFT_182593 [Amanita muscaria Koide BX008]
MNSSVISQRSSAMFRLGFFVKFLQSSMILQVTTRRSTTSFRSASGALPFADSLCKLLIASMAGWFVRWAVEKRWPGDSYTLATNFTNRLLTTTQESGSYYEGARVPVQVVRQSFNLSSRFLRLYPDPDSSLQTRDQIMLNRGLSSPACYPYVFLVPIVHCRFLCYLCVSVVNFISRLTADNAQLRPIVLLDAHLIPKASSHWQLFDNYYEGDSQSVSSSGNCGSFSSPVSGSR